MFPFRYSTSPHRHERRGISLFVFMAAVMAPCAALAQDAPSPAADAPPPAADAPAEKATPAPDSGADAPAAPANTLGKAAPCAPPSKRPQPAAIPREQWREDFTLAAQVVTAIGGIAGVSALPVGLMSIDEGFEETVREEMRVLAVAIGVPAAIITVVGAGLWVGVAATPSDEDGSASQRSLAPQIGVGPTSLALRWSF